MKLLIRSSQVPPFWHGSEEHSSTSTETGNSCEVKLIQVLEGVSGQVGSALRCSFRNSLMWQRRPVNPARQEQVKDGFPVMQSSMQRPPF